MFNKSERISPEMLNGLAPEYVLVATNRKRNAFNSIIKRGQKFHN